MATVAVTRLPSGALGLLGWVTLGERRRLALARSATLLEQLLELGDAGVSLPERFAQALDLGFEPNDDGTKIAYRVSATARRRGRRRNSQTVRAWREQVVDPAKQVPCR